MPLNKSPIFFLLLLVSSSSILSFRYSFLLMLKCLLVLHLTLFRLSKLLWFRYCNHCIVWSKNRKHSSLNHGLSSFNSYRLRLVSAEVLIFSFTFSQVLLMCLLPFKFPELQTCRYWYRYCHDFISSLHIYLILLVFHIACRSSIPNSFTVAFLLVFEIPNDIFEQLACII